MACPTPEDLDEDVHQSTLSVSVSVSPPGDLVPGSKASLHCQVAGLDAPVQWKKKNGSQHPESPTVNIQNVAPSDAGTWQCTVSSAGVTYSEDLVIQVKSTNVLAYICFQTTNNNLCETMCFCFQSLKLQHPLPEAQRSSANPPATSVRTAPVGLCKPSVGKVSVTHRLCFLPFP